MSKTVYNYVQRIEGQDWRARGVGVGVMSRLGGRLIGKQELKLSFIFCKMGIIT